MKPELSRIISDKLNRYMNNPKLTYTIKDKSTISNMNLLHKELIDFTSTNNIQSITDIPKKFDEIMKE